jgi:hypothetical protein
MHDRSVVVMLALTAALLLAPAGARAFDEAQYPNLKGRWDRVGPPRWNPADYWNKNAPVIPEYKAIHAANLADQEAGGQGTDPTYVCLAPGMPRVMNAYEPMEIVVTPRTTYILISHIHDSRRIYTDGRDWPKGADPSFTGYSIGKWIDEDGDGKYDVLAVETRNFKGPRTFDESGLLLHSDNETIVKERIYLDKKDPRILYDEITTLDDALTHPWTITKKFQRDPDPRPVWREVVCSEDNQHVEIGKQSYFLSADGYLMPTRKDQPPPDFRYFPQTKK